MPAEELPDEVVAVIVRQCDPETLRTTVRQLGHAWRDAADRTLHQDEEQTDPPVGGWVFR